MADKDALLQRGRAEENRFFAERDRELIDKLKQQQEDEHEQTVKELALARCPRDGERLTQRDLQGVSIDDCPVCHGMWLDKGELEALSERQGSAGVGNFLSQLTSILAPKKS
jgi:hypothetical protein